MNREIKQPKILDLTEELNALDYFEKAVFFARETQNSDFAWKWVVLSLHGALYGFAISACRGTDSSNVVQKNKLITFDEALKCCEQGYAGKALVLSAEERESIRRLSKVLRDHLEHYIPGNWIIELHGFPAMALNCIRVITTLATETSNWVHLSEIQRQHVKSLADEFKMALMKSPL